MIKNLILILTITTLLPKTTIQQEWCGDREFFECLNQIMQELSLCFETITDYSVLPPAPNDAQFATVPGDFGVAYSIFGGKEHQYPITVNALEYVGLLIPTDEATTNTVRKKAIRLFHFANSSYAFYSIKNRQHVAYHNICHGLQVMIFAGMIYYSAKSNKGMTATQQFAAAELQALMFAGLFHDAAHPGFGNDYYKNLDDDCAELHATIKANIKAFADHGDGVEEGDKVAIKALGDKIGVLAGTNKEGDFLLENIHSLIGTELLKIITRSDGDHAKKALVKKAIDGTAYGVAESVISFNELKGSIATYTKYEEIEGLIGKMIEARNAYKIESFVHMADISANATHSRRFMLATVKGCLYEFLKEIAALQTRKNEAKISAEDAKAVIPYKTIGEKDFEKIMTSQIFFTDAIIRHELLFNYILRFDIVKEYDKLLRETADKADLTLQGDYDLEKEGEYRKQIAMYELWSESFETLVEKFKEPFTKYKESIVECDIVEYFRVNLEKNLEFFANYGDAEIPNDLDFVDKYYMYVSKNIWDANKTIV